MKKTSIFFLIIAVVLVIAGIIVRNTGTEKAEEKNLELFRQTLTDSGDFVETIEFSSEDTNKININLINTDINIIGNAEKSYVEIVNFNALEYATYFNNRSFTVENDLISAIVGRAEGGNISFNGVRDYVRLDKHNSARKVNVYLSSNASVKIFDIKINNGNISIDNVNLICDYNIVMNKGNITCKNTSEISLIKAEIQKGDINLEKLYTANADLTVHNGNVSFTTPSNLIYDYSAESETGEIKYNQDVHKGVFSVENDEINGTFTAHVGVGNISIQTYDPVVSAPAETTNA